MSTRLEDLVIRLTADNTDLKRQLGKSQSDIAGFAKGVQGQLTSLRSSFNQIGVAFGLFKGFQLFKSAIESSLDLADSLQNASERMDLTAEGLQRLQAAAEPFGVSSDRINSALLKFSKNLGDARVGTGSLAKVLKDTSPALLATLTNAKDTSEAFLILSDAVKGLENPTEQARLAQAALGRGGLELLGVLKQGSEEIERIGDATQRWGGILSNEAVAALDDFGDALGRVQRAALVGFSEGLAGSDSNIKSLTATLSDPDTLSSIAFWSKEIASLSAEFLSLAGAALKAAQSLVEWKRAQLRDAGVDLGPALGLGGGSFRGHGASGSWADTAGPPLLPSVILGGGPKTRGGGSSGKNPDISDIKIAFEQIMGAPLKDFHKFGDEMEKEMAAIVKSGNKAAEDLRDEWDANAAKMEARGELLGSFLGNVFRDFADDGKVELKSLVASFFEALIEMEIRAAASSIFGAASGAGGGSGTSSLIGGLISSVAGSLGGVLSPKIAGGGGGNVTIVNQVHPAVEVSAQRDQKGELQVMVTAAVKREAAGGGFRRTNFGAPHQPGAAS